MTDAVIQVVRDASNRLRGELFGAIEAVGLPERQEEAIKKLIRKASYDAQATIEAAVRET